MKRIDLRLPDDLHARVKILAERERRSLHAQVLRILEDATATIDSGDERVR